MADNWVSPTGFEDDGNGWSNEASGYDDNLGTDADSDIINAEANSEAIAFTHTAISCDKVRFHADTSGEGDINVVSVAVWYDSGWNSIYTGAFTENLMTEKSIPAGIKSVSKIGMYFQNNGEEGGNAHVNEVDFNRVLAPVAIHHLKQAGGL